MSAAYSATSAASISVSTLIATKVAASPAAAAAACVSTSCALQFEHHVAKNSTKTGLPARSVSRKVVPSTSVMSNFCHAAAFDSAMPIELAAVVGAAVVEASAAVVDGDDADTSGASVADVLAGGSVAVVDATGSVVDDVVPVEPSSPHAVTDSAPITAISHTARDVEFEFSTKIPFVD